MATGKRNGSREAQERARLYQARQQLHDAQVRRRRRDNVLAAVVGGLVVVAAVGVQTLYFTAGPGAPAPEPSSSVSPAPSVSPSPSDAPAPGESAPAGTQSPAPTEPAG